MKIFEFFFILSMGSDQIIFGIFILGFDHVEFMLFLIFEFFNLIFQECDLKH